MKKNIQVVTASLALLVSAGVLAQAPPAGGPPVQTHKFDFTPFIQEVDTNKDGKFSLAEWQAAKQFEPIFTMFDTDKDGVLTVAELTVRMPQLEADKNKDGKISAAEMADLPNMGPSGGAPPPAAPAK